MGALHDLVLKLFSAEEFRRWLRHGPDADIVPELPGEAAADATVVDRALGALERRGRIDADFFARMTVERDRQREAIAVVAALWVKSQGAPRAARTEEAMDVIADRVADRWVKAPSAPAEPPVRESASPPARDVPVGAADDAPPQRAARGPRWRMLQAANAVVAWVILPGAVVGLVSLGLGLYGALGGAEDRGNGEDAPETTPASTNMSRADELTTTTTTSTASSSTESQDEPTTKAIVCDREDQSPEGLSCVPRCPEGTKFIKGTHGAAFDREGAQRDVDDFCLDITEVTVAAFREKASAESFTKSKSLLLPGNKPSEYSKFDKYCNARRTDREDHPMNCVDWAQAQAHCETIGGRLPTEWEWEWAARGRDEGREYPWGEEAPDCKRAIFSPESVDGCGKDRTWAVGTLNSELSDSRDGLKDMSGNVWEWTFSIYGDDVGGQGLRVLRGGGWDYDDAVNMRTSRRIGSSPTSRDFASGFRCARTIR